MVTTGRVYVPSAIEEGGAVVAMGCFSSQDTPMNVLRSFLKKPPPVVLDRARAIGTAVDVVCTRGKYELVLVELKTGFGGDRAQSGGTYMEPPLGKAKDCHINRHFAQLATTMHLFKQEETTLAKLLSKGIDQVSGCVLYVDGDLSEKFELPAWWEKRGARIVDRIS